MSIPIVKAFVYLCSKVSKFMMKSTVNMNGYAVRVSSNYCILEYITTVLFYCKVPLFV